MPITTPSQQLKRIAELEEAYDKAEQRARILKREFQAEELAKLQLKRIAELEEAYDKAEQAEELTKLRAAERTAARHHAFCVLSLSDYLRSVYQG